MTLRTRVLEQCFRHALYRQVQVRVCKSELSAEPEPLCHALQTAGSGAAHSVRRFWDGCEFCDAMMMVIIRSRVSSIAQPCQWCCTLFCAAVGFAVEAGGRDVEGLLRALRRRCGAGWQRGPPHLPFAVCSCCSVVRWARLHSASTLEFARHSSYVACHLGLPMLCHPSSHARARHQGRADEAGT